jgi:hypothetical protein
VPTIVRPMLHDNGIPRIGVKANCLGVRPGYDVKEEAGHVKLDRSGMSVNDRLASVPSFLQSQLEDTGLNGADGPKKLRLFIHGTGGFIEERVANGLTLYFKTENEGTPVLTAGNVAPETEMTLAEYQSVLAATQLEWQPVLQ